MPRSGRSSPRAYEDLHQSYHDGMAERPIFEFSAGGLVVDESGRVLLIRARDLRNRPVWTLPKGTLIKGETSADAALREVREETGYRCEVMRALESVTYWFQRDGCRIRKSVDWFLMRPLEKVGEHDHEVDEVAWADRTDALSRLRYDSDRRLLTTTLTE
jgi:8-oxo-dGTP pyrophosphatase MutT (NUDIX family)